MIETKELIISNNPLAAPQKGEQLLFINSNALAIYYKVRDFIHLGWQMITHPLTGNIKPTQIHYKTIYLKYEDGSIPDSLSVTLISDAIMLLTNTTPETLDENTLNDLMFIDWELSKQI